MIGARTKVVHVAAVLILPLFATGAFASATDEVKAEAASRVRVEAAALLWTAMDWQELAPRQGAHTALGAVHGKLQEIRGHEASAHPAVVMLTPWDVEIVQLEDVAHWVVQAFDAGPLSKELRRALSPAKYDENGWTDLHYAAALDLRRLAVALLDAGAEIGARLKSDGAPLSDGLRDTLRSLGHDFDDWKRLGATPLHVAAWTDARDVATVLIERGAQVYVQDDSAKTPLDLATENNASKVAAVLREQQDVITDRIDRVASARAGGLMSVLGRSLSPSFVDENGWTDLHYAASLDLSNVAQILLEAGMSADARIKDDNEALSSTVRQTLLNFGPFPKMLRWRRGETALHVAAMADSPNVAGALIDRGADVSAKNIRGDVPLHLAAWTNAREVAVLLIDRGADVNAKNYDGTTPLHWAAWENASEVSVLLIDRGADVNANDNEGFTPLHWAALEVSVLLIDRGADVNANDDEGYTPLHWAAWENASEVANLLIDRGADPNTKSDSGNAPLHLAARSNAREVANLLIEHGADLWTRNSDGATPLDIAVQTDADQVAAELKKPLDRLARFDAGPLSRALGRPFSPSDKDGNGWTDLHYAAALNLPDLAEALLDAGADVDAPLVNDDEFLSEPLQRRLHALGWGHGLPRWALTPLHVAAMADAQAAAASLIDRGASVDGRDRYQRTPLYWAANTQGASVAALLIDRGADINGVDDLSITPLHAAAESNNRTVAQLLIDRGVSVQTADRYGRTPLHFAARANWVDNPSAAALLIDRGASIDSVDANYKSPLYYAAEFGSVAVVSLLLDHGAEVEGGFLRKAPLNIAAAKNNVAVARLLIDRGADIDLTHGHCAGRFPSFHYGDTPLEVAKEHDAHDVVELLLQRATQNCLSEILGRAFSPTQIGEGRWRDLHYAAALNLPDLARNLLDRAAKVDARLHDSNQALSAGLLQTLADLGRNYDGWTLQGQTPLHFAATANEGLSVATVLIDHMADIDIQDSSGNVPLHYAARHSAALIAALLINRGADVDATNDAGIAPLQAAINHNASDVVRLLQRKRYK